MIICDPPGGWRYGFPKPLDKTIPYEEYLRKNGYPEKEIPFALVWSRYWDDENDGHRPLSREGSPASALA